MFNVIILGGVCYDCVLGVDHLWLGIVWFVPTCQTCFHEPKEWHVGYFFNTHIVIMEKISHTCLIVFMN